MARPAEGEADGCQIVADEQYGEVLVHYLGSTTDLISEAVTLELEDGYDLPRQSIYQSSES